MESYPTELLLGVFPLVFCVDATLASKDVAAGGTSGSPGNSGRSQFDRFLDTIAALLLDDPDTAKEPVLSSPISRQRSHDEVMRGLFRGEEGVVDSDHEDDLIFGMEGGDIADVNSKPTRTFAKNLKFGGLGRDANAGAPRNSATRGSASKDGSNFGGTDFSFAKTFQEGQGFFQRARIVSISSRHGFPPSKDPQGEHGRIQEYFLGKTLRKEAILAATQRRPLDGILPSGWLEKHAAALPSAIIVLAQVNSHTRRYEQNSLLEETMRNIQISLATKRGCTIRVVGLVQEGISTQVATEWKQEMVQKLEGHPPITLLDVADLQLDSVTSVNLKLLHKSIHDASSRYYAAQARRTKQKLYDLGPARNTPFFLPLAIRYCFKIAMIYEFRWRHEKSLKYLAEAYRHVETYYRYLLQHRDPGSAGLNDPSTPDVDAPKIQLSNYGRSASDGSESDGVETPIHHEDDLSRLLLNPPAIPDDMVLQCRVLADWLNFKILQSCFTSHTDGGLLAASNQWRRHIQVFCNPRRSFVCSPDHAFVDWSFVAHQRMVASQLMERNPPRAKLGGQLDESILRFLPGKSYEAAAEALLRLGNEVKKAATRNQNTGTIVDAMRSRYVGGLDRNGYQPKLQEAMKIDYFSLVLDCLRRAISFLESGEAGDLKSTKRNGARLYYLAGGILLGRNEYAEATTYLEKAALLAKGWSDLESKIRLLLVKSYESYIPKVESKERLRLASLLLGSYFKADISPPDLQLALSRFASSIAPDMIMWHEEVFDEDDHTNPISFVLTFQSTHARAGDTVKAGLVIKSNFDYDFEIDALELFTSAGKIALQPGDLRPSDGQGDGVGSCLLKAMSTLSITASIELPKEISKIAFDESLGSSKLKVARPRTAGLTAAGKQVISAQPIKCCLLHALTTTILP
jgi:tetratricopeptide (TPR) repeat protein